MEFTNFLNTTGILSISGGIKQLQQSGNIVYEYNPLKVYRVNEDITETIEGVTTIITPKNSLTELDTDLLKFDLEHPVNIIPQPSYDGSVNLILNDGQNDPRLINTRFTTTGFDTYKIVDREGDNDTNIYDEDTFSSDVSLYKKINGIPQVQFLGLNTSGRMSVGNYVFYFKLSDSDGNETDFVAESGIVTCHIGSLLSPDSIQGGISDENSGKSVLLRLTNIDSSYNNIIVYYSRSTSDLDGNEITSFKKINKQYPVYNKISNITISGFESVFDISEVDINTNYSLVQNSFAQTICQNRLFLGNVKKPDIDYKDLADIALRFCPTLDTSQNIGYLNHLYKDTSNSDYKGEYYNVDNIYNRLGYWNDIYRIGIVFILDDFTLSPVFNVRGKTGLSTNTTFSDYSTFELKTGDERNFIKVDQNTNKLTNSSDENSKGVIQIDSNYNQFTTDGVVPIGLKFTTDDATYNYIKERTKGYFFVRQKRIQTTLCQAVTIAKENISNLPVLPIAGSKHILERFITGAKLLSHDFSNRTVTDLATVDSGGAALCPEYELNSSKFNQIFTGSEFIVENAYNKFNSPYFTQSANYFYNLDFSKNNAINSKTINITGVEDSTQTVRGKTNYFSAKAGSAEEAYRVSYYNAKSRVSGATNLIRGCWGPYLGIEGSDSSSMEVLNIKIPNYDSSKLDSYMEVRYNDSSSFFPITHRLEWNSFGSLTENLVTTHTLDNVFRGDCFIGNYTHRMCRNFQDPSAPTIDDIVDEYSWKDNYEYGDSTSNAKINRADVNAVKIGHWVTIKVCSNINLAMRCLDGSRTSEEGLTGRKRGFYPLQSMSTDGVAKLPESNIINGGLNSTTSDKYNYDLPNVPAFKNVFHTRIMYSDININDAFKNNYRVFRSQNYRDYPLSYGSITKLIEMGGNLFCVFEHGISIIPVNERTVAGDGTGGSVYINTSNVLPENPKVISDTFGSQWAEAVLKTPLYVYGIDTVGKKIWRANSQGIQVISDFQIQKFLNENIYLTETESTPIIGIRNVKVHYNKFKQDVMFTFYNEINSYDEKAWSICYNELTEKWTTFYSWIPSSSENIDNIFFSFDRDTSRYFGHFDNTNKLIYVTNPITTSLSGTYTDFALHNHYEVGNNLFKYELIDANPNLYEIVNDTTLRVHNPTALLTKYVEIPIKMVVYTGDQGGTIEVEYAEKATIYDKILITNKTYHDGLTTSFWKHGQAGLTKTTTDIKPTMWYGKQHPFEFEFMVRESEDAHKIFASLDLLANKVAPESVHFEVSGDVYSFSEDLINTFFRQEATKHIYQYNGSDISYDSRYLKVIPNHLYNPIYQGYDKSTMFPLYYSRVDKTNAIEDYYQTMTSNGHCYQNLSGSEIVYDKVLNQYRIATHIKVCPFSEFYQIDGKWYQYGRLRGNADYLEDQWSIQIPSIVYWQKNESNWITTNGVSYPPINLVNNPIPEDTTLTVEEDIVPQALVDLGYSVTDVNTYTGFDLTSWGNRKETRIRDKYLKVKIRYTGDKLAIISSITTLYNTSYA